MPWEAIQFPSAVAMAAASGTNAVTDVGERRAEEPSSGAVDVYTVGAVALDAASSGQGASKR